MIRHPKRLHAVRIEVKHCRSAAEAVIPLVRDVRTGRARRFLRRLTRLQHALGALADAVNENARLRDVASSYLDRFVAGDFAELEQEIAASSRAARRKASKHASKRKSCFRRPA